MSDETLGTLIFFGLVIAMFVIGAWINPRGETKAIRRMFFGRDVRK